MTKKLLVFGLFFVARWSNADYKTIVLNTIPVQMYVRAECRGDYYRRYLPAAVYTTASEKGTSVVTPGVNSFETWRSHHGFSDVHAVGAKVGDVWGKNPETGEPLVFTAKMLNKKGEYWGTEKIFYSLPVAEYFQLLAVPIKNPADNNNWWLQFDIEREEVELKKGARYESIVEPRFKVGKYDAPIDMVVRNMMPVEVKSKWETSHGPVEKSVPAAIYSMTVGENGEVFSLTPGVAGFDRQHRLSTGFSSVRAVGVKVGEAWGKNPETGESLGFTQTMLNDKGEYWGISPTFYTLPVGKYFELSVVPVKNPADNNNWWPSFRIIRKSMKLVPTAKYEKIGGVEYGKVTQYSY
ncbi:MAG TPA: hypothetical protein VGT41_01145 [Candidatus Babeliales bacterium]|nr:hypothetical protein [Candidatus Babeliales bacterium]